ncbi:MAG: cobalt-precorrin-5B (C1)-methyltransferase [Alphaproteobacteria bacterium]|jgi:cobalt-precorrin-5B (C1)-methyltransferase
MGGRAKLAPMVDLLQTGPEQPGRKPEGPLRRGWTTGACATAAARAAYEALLTGTFPDPVVIRLPRGQRAPFALAETSLEPSGATAGVIKDAGDDPDVTHGALIKATVTQAPAGAGVLFAAGEGVGTVTLPGLPLAVGEPAINPKPRAMMAAAIGEVAAEYGAVADITITVSIPGGAELAARTSNARLGIVGGLSVLGTTGVVIPYSCASWIHSIHRGVDVARATGLSHIAAATGRTSETAIRELYGLSEQALIDMGDFAGGLLKYLRDHPVARLTVAGGFGKLSKLADGHLDLHSDHSQVDVSRLAGRLSPLGVDEKTIAAARNAPSAGAVLALAHECGVAAALANAVALAAREVARATLAGATDVEIIVIARDGTILGRAEF